MCSYYIKLLSYFIMVFYPIAILEAENNYVSQWERKLMVKDSIALSCVRQFGFVTNGQYWNYMANGYSLGDIENPIRKYQIKQGLIETGEINDDTLKMMIKPRCGAKNNEDIINN